MDARSELQEMDSKQHPGCSAFNNTNNNGCAIASAKAAAAQASDKNSATTQSVATPSPAGTGSSGAATKELSDSSNVERDAEKKVNCKYLTKKATEKMNLCKDKTGPKALKICLRKNGRYYLNKLRAENSCQQSYEELTRQMHSEFSKKVKDVTYEELFD